MAYRLERFEDMLERLGGQGRAAAINTYELYQAGLIDRTTFIDVASELIQHINEVGATYGQLAYHGTAEILTGEALDVQRVAAAPVRARTTRDGLATALTTILDSDVADLAMNLGRLAYVTTIEETQDGYADEMERDPRVEGWERGLDATACELCVWWWREGRIWPKDHPMPRHKGCKCQQIPRIGDVSPTVYTRNLERRREAIRNRDRRSAQVRQLIQAGEL